MSQERFHYKTLEEVKERAEELKVYLPFSSSTDILKTPLKVGNVTFHNRMGIAPIDRKSTRLNSSHVKRSRMPSSA